MHKRNVIKDLIYEAMRICLKLNYKGYQITSFEYEMCCANWNDLFCQDFCCGRSP